ncbi:MAG: hypothetical protein M3068_04350 [Gemmatimonadota bacterium]|nr:hypothetical protein [Gemmatimonadota bacterium]
MTLGVGCADFSTARDPTGGLPDVEVTAPSFSRDIQPIFTRRCSIGGCHSFASHRAGLVLQAPYAYDSLVGIRSTIDPRFLRVRPFKGCGDLSPAPCYIASDSSWIARMLSGDSTRRFANVRMPLASTPLTARQIQTIVNWINQGALRN